jgi:two-component system, NarL family, response regulator LiaR
LVNGDSYKLIAFHCGISMGTVRTHIVNIYEKLHVNSKSEAVAKALKSGF